MEILYLGAKLRKFTLHNGVKAWGFSPSKYVNDAIKNMENYLRDEMNGLKLPRKAATPFENDYTPEMDTTSELNPKTATFYQTQVGVLRWIVELGRIDIITEASLLASQMALPREGHLDALQNWTNFYGDVQEPIPPNAPEPAGKEVDIQLFVDSDHAGDKKTRQI